MAGDVKGRKRGKGKKEPRSFVGVEALLVFPDHGDYVATLDLMRRFSAAYRYGYNRLLEGEEREKLKRKDGPLCTLFRLNTRYADDALLKAQTLLASLEEQGENPRKVVFGGRKDFLRLLLLLLQSSTSFHTTFFRLSRPALPSLRTREGTRPQRGSASDRPHRR